MALTELFLKSEKFSEHFQCARSVVLQHVLYFYNINPVRNSGIYLPEISFDENGSLIIIGHPAFDAPELVSFLRRVVKIVCNIYKPQKDQNSAKALMPVASPCDIIVII